MILILYFDLDHLLYRIIYFVGKFLLQVGHVVVVEIHLWRLIPRENGQEVANHALDDGLCSYRATRSVGIGTFR